MSMRRVAITGLGTLCGLGHSTEEVWKNALEGKSGISEVESIDTSALGVKIAGEVKNFSLSEDILEAREQGRYDKFIHYALHSSSEALKDSALLEADYDRSKIGCILGVGMGGFPFIEQGHSTFLEKGPRRVTPFFIPSLIPNMASGMVTIKFGLHGINYTVASACASAGHAISMAAFEIMSGRQDAVVTGGAESTICYLPFAGFTNMKALSKRNDEPTRASRPFDKDRDGFVMGEGAGILILEDLEKAKARGAKIYAEVIGHGYSSDAYHITAPHPEGEGAILAIQGALDLAKVPLSEVGYVNAHGTSTPLGDIAETKALKKVFGDHAKNLFVSSTKSMTGHLLGAAGGVESVFTTLALNKKILPPTINLENQDPECDLNYIPNKPIEKEVEYALNNSFGFGGTNSTLVFKAYR